MVQNKVLPGAYINFVSRPRVMGGLGERGVVCVGMELDWGSPGMMSVEAAECRTDSRRLFGYDYADEKMKDMRELFLHAKRVKRYRLNGGEAAKATLGSLTATAKYTGARGNDICVAVAANVDEAGKYDVETYLGTEQVDIQTVATIEELEDNGFVTFSGTGAPKATAGTYLTGGTTAATTGSGYTAFLEAAEAEDFNVLYFLVLV